MQVLHVNKVTINHAGREIFRDLSWAIDERDRVGLVGPNGAGKSSLLKAITGEYALEAGVISRMKGARVGYLPQEARVDADKTVFEAAMALPPELARIEADLNAVEARMSDPDVYGDDGRLAAALAEQERLVAQWEAAGGP